MFKKKITKYKNQLGLLAKIAVKQKKYSIKNKTKSDSVNLGPSEWQKDTIQMSHGGTSKRLPKIRSFIPNQKIPISMDKN